MLPPEAIKVIETLPEDERHAVEDVVRMVAKSHRGPLPDGETLEHYTRLIPNAGERMMALGTTDEMGGNDEDEAPSPDNCQSNRRHNV